LDETKRSLSKNIDIIGIDQLQPHLDKTKILTVVRDALIMQAEGKVQSPPPGQLLFKQPHGDCHIKFGHVAGAETFAIKIACGFYENPMKGLPVNHGLILIMNAKTGAPLVILKDDGWLTAWRTSAALALAAQALAPPKIEAIGIFGTGLQASLAAEWVTHVLGQHPICVCSRDTGRASNFAKSLKGMTVSIADNAEDLLSRCNLVITATPSEKPLFKASSVRPGTHVVAIGADGTGKQELPVELFEHVACIVTDDIAQSLKHGDFGTAVRQGLVRADRALMLGDLLSGKRKHGRKPTDITIADLTGIAAEDIAIAEYFYRALGTQK
jgi:ornithine cyclodeaminase